MMHCSPKLFLFSALVLGAIAVGTLGMGVATDSWIHTSEWDTPYLDNETVTAGLEQFKMRSGLWRMCLAGLAECIAIEYFQQDSDRDKTTPISISITRGIRSAAPLAVSALVFVVFAFMLGIVGGIKQDIRAIIAAVLFILSGLLVAAGMILYISAVNDEVGHGSKFKPDGKDFHYSYGWSFSFIGISFICSELTAVFYISFYISLHSSQEKLIELIPGLEGKIESRYPEDQDDELTDLKQRFESPTLIL